MHLVLLLCCFPCPSADWQATRHKLSSICLPFSLYMVVSPPTKKHLASTSELGCNLLSVTEGLGNAAS